MVSSGNLICDKSCMHLGGRSSIEINNVVSLTPGNFFFDTIPGNCTHAGGNFTVANSKELTV